MNDALTRSRLASDELRRFAARGPAVLDSAARSRLATVIEDLVRETRRIGVETLTKSALEIAAVLRRCVTPEQTLPTTELYQLAIVLDCLAEQLRRRGVIAVDRVELDGSPINVGWLGFD